MEIGTYLIFFGHNLKQYHEAFNISDNSAG